MCSQGGIRLFGRAAGSQMDRGRSSTAMTSFEGIERAAIGNDRAWKVMVTNYYVGDDFRDVGGIDRNLNWLVSLCD